MTNQYSIDINIDADFNIVPILLCLTLCVMAILSVLWYMGVI